MINFIICLQFLFFFSTAIDLLSCKEHKKRAYAGCQRGYYCSSGYSGVGHQRRCNGGCSLMPTQHCQSSFTNACDANRDCKSCGNLLLNDNICEWASGQVGNDPDEGCFAVDSTVLVSESGVESESRMEALEESFKVQVFDGEKVDFQPAYVKFFESQGKRLKKVMKLSTTSGRNVRATLDHLFHFGESCCSYKSMKKISDFQEGDAIWVLGDNGKPVQDVVSSLSEPFGVSRVANVVPFDRVKPSPKTNGQCKWDATNFIIVNGFISTHHAVHNAYGRRSSNTLVDVSSVSIEDRLLAYDVFSDELLLGFKDMGSSVRSRVVSGDTEHTFLDFMEDLKGLIQYCSNVHECDLEFLKKFFANLEVDSEVAKWMDWKIQIEAASTYDLVFGSADRAAFAYKLIQQIRAAKEGRLCTTLDLSMRASFLYSMFGKFASMWH